MDGKSWELEPEEFRALRLAIKRAFLTEKSLEIMVWENLGERLNEITQGGNINEIVFGLIQWSESTGRLQELFVAAACDQSGNWELQDFVKKYISKRFDLDGYVLSAEALVKLIAVLKKASDLMAILEIGKTILPSNIHVHRPQKIEGLEQPDLSNWFKCFILLKLLVEDYPQLEQRPSLPTFAEYLYQDENLDESIKQPLEEWLDKFDPDFNRQSGRLEAASDSASPQPRIGALQAYLMITVNPEKSKRKIRAIASLLCIAPTGERREIPVHLDPESNERGVLCTRKKLPDIIGEFIQHSIECELNNPENLLGCAYYDLTIELFLPSEFLCEPIDRWKVRDEFDNPVYLGSKHRLVLRSYDRVAKPSLKNNFSKSWHSARAFLIQRPDAASLQKKIQCLDRINCNQLARLTEELRQKIGLKVICALPESKTEFFRAMLKSGVPIAFWTRSRELSSAEIMGGIDRFLTLELLLDPCNLLERVRAERALAFEDCETLERRWGRHLTVLWDDWERMPTLEPLSREGSNRHE